MRPVREWITLGRRLPGEFLDVVDLKGKMGQVGPDQDRAALVKLAELDFLLASGRFQEDQLRAAPRGVAPDFLQPENIAIK